MMLHAETWPGQIPWRSLLPKELDNLVVPVCFSATHVAWGAIRLEPTWMQTGESTGLAAALARRDNVPVAKLDPARLTRKLAEEHSLITFFNDLPADFPAAKAALFFGGYGFFPTCDARLDEPVESEVMKLWAQQVEAISSKKPFDPQELAKRLAPLEKQSPFETRTRGEALIELYSQLSSQP